MRRPGRAGFRAWFFFPFIADASVTLALRLLRGARIWVAHREHYYQKLVLLGVGHRGTLAIYGALMIGTAASALLALIRAPSSGPAVVGLWSVAMAVLFSTIEYHWRRRDMELNESKH